MSFNTQHFRKAIEDGAAGHVGAVRTVSIGTMQAGVFAGMNEQAQQARALTARHRVDVRLGRLRNHEATPVSGNAPTRLMTLDVLST